MGLLNKIFNCQHCGIFFNRDVDSLITIAPCPDCSLMCYAIKNKREEETTMRSYDFNKSPDENFKSNENEGDKEDNYPHFDSLITCAKENLIRTMKDADDITLPSLINIMIELLEFERDE